MGVDPKDVKDLADPHNRNSALDVLRITDISLVEALCSRVAATFVPLTRPLILLRPLLPTGTLLADTRPRSEYAKVISKAPSRSSPPTRISTSSCWT